MSRGIVPLARWRGKVTAAQALRGGPVFTTEAVTEPGAILSDDELEALDRRLRAAPTPRRRLVEAALDRQIAAKRETRSLPELLLATGAMQTSHLRTPWHARATQAARRMWANAVARWRFRRWYAAMLRATHQRCRQQLRELA